MLENVFPSIRAGSLTRLERILPKLQLFLLLSLYSELHARLKEHRAFRIPRTLTFEAYKLSKPNTHWNIKLEKWVPQRPLTHKHILVKRGCRAWKQGNVPSARTNERREHARCASLSRLRGVANERVGNARASNLLEGERRDERREEKSRALREVMCAAAARKERGDAKRDERRSEMRVARRTRGVRRSAAAMSKKTFGRKAARRSPVRSGREESGKCSGEQPSTYTCL